MANSSGYVGINGGGGGGSYVSLTGDESIDGIKTFTSFPVTPSSAPTSDYQAANKKYVDDNAGGAGANIETLTGNKTLTSSDEEYQIYRGTAYVSVQLPLSGPAGMSFVIKNNNSSGSSVFYTIKKESGIEIDKLGSDMICRYIFDGSSWHKLGFQNNIGIGHSVFSKSFGVSVGYYSSGNNAYGVGIGYGASSNSDGGVGIGRDARNNNEYAVGIGTEATGQYKTYSTALGSYSQVERKGEYIEGIDTIHYGNKAIHSKWKYYGETTDGSTHEIYVRGISGNRMEILAKEVVQFTMQVTAIDSTNYDAKVWEVKGAIKRDASNNTSLVGSITKTVIAQDSGATNWDIFVTADNTYNALKLEVSEVDVATGKTIRWAATSYNTEVRFTYLY